MNREIKFRGKSEEAWEWFYWDLWRREQNGRWDISWFITCLGGRVEEVTPETVGEFTWLKDNLWKEIYEGDIITVKPTGEFKLWGDRDTPSVVEWDGCCYSFHEYKTLFHFVDTKNYVVTVIGNFCENPELLNQK